MGELERLFLDKEEKEAEDFENETMLYALAFDSDFIRLRARDELFLSATIFQIEASWCSKRIMLEYIERCGDSYTKDVVGFWLFKRNRYVDSLKELIPEYRSVWDTTIEFDLSFVGTTYLNRYITKILPYVYDTAWVWEPTEILTINNEKLRKAYVKSIKHTRREIIPL